MSELAPSPAAAPPRPAAPRHAPWGEALPFARAGLTLQPAPPARRFLLRGRRAVLAPLARLVDLSLPATIGATVVCAGRAALMLGPDEWMLNGPEEDPWWEDFRTRAAAALGEGRGAVFEVSHHHAAFIAEGEHVGALLNAGCPLDLDSRAFPPGRAVRTLFGRVPLLLWREGEGRFLLMTTRSLARALAELLRAAAPGAAL